MQYIFGTPVSSKLEEVSEKLGKGAGGGGQRGFKESPEIVFYQHNVYVYQSNNLRVSVVLKKIPKM